MLQTLRVKIVKPKFLLFGPVLLLAAATLAVLGQSASGLAVSDGFNRADGRLGSNWTTVAGTAAPKITGGVLGTGTANTLNSAYWSANTFGSDQYVQATMPNSTGGNYGPGIAVRLSSSKGYFLWYGNYDNYVSIWRMDSATSWTELTQSNQLTVNASTDVWKLQAVGSTISAYQNGNLVAQTTDTGITAGAPGVWMYYGDNQITNWSGGDVTGAPTYAVGGSVSGLSGTVVLQNNGGDDLSVTADGSYAFTTKLATGSPYDVTVKTNPSNQTCAVSNATGTVATSDVTNIAVSCTTNASGTATDDFNRANGPLGSNWTDMSDGGLTITGDAVAGATAGNTGDIRTGETYASDQYSEVVTTATQPAGAQWIGPSVRSQNNGQNDYLGIYYWNSGNPDLMLFKRISGGWTQLGSAYNSGALPAGTDLQLTAVGSTITFLENGVARITATDTSLTGGAPGIMAYGNTGTLDNWSGGNMTTGPSYTIGGAVSGLTGSVTLQDNSADDLTVNADGSFTFATPVPSGEPYSVTVKTEPSGQYCSVANSSGTVGSGNVTNVSVVCQTDQNGSGTDNFNRANGLLGSNWSDDSDGGLSITSGAAAGTNAAATTGDSYAGAAYPSDQYSQVELTANSASGGQWVGPAVRMQNGGQNGYAGIYFANSGNPELMLFRRDGASWAQLGVYNSGALPAGTQLKLVAVGDTIALLENGTERIAVYDATYTGGAPGIMAYGTSQVGNWSGGSAGFSIDYLSTDSNGVQSYDVLSANDGHGPQPLRVLKPTNPAAGVKHNFLIVLPVQPGEQSDFGDGMQTMLSANVQNKYNLTVIEPSFAIDPWYANNPSNPDEQQETFMTQELMPWIKANLATTGTEQTWLIGFSKSGIGGQDLILKHPDLFTLAASWDFPADMSAYDQYGPSSTASYGTDANFQANYRLSSSFLDAHKAPFTSTNRIWIGGYGAFQQDDSDYNTLLTAEGIAHTAETPTYMTHRWDSGWVPLALQALYQDSLNLGS